MKKVNSILTLTFLLGSFCFFQARAQTVSKSAKVIQSTTKNPPLKAAGPQKKVQKIDAHYTGVIDKQQLMESSYTKGWFMCRYKRFSPNKRALRTLREKLQHYRLVLFMGTWCPDSHREVPKLYKILKQAHYPIDSLRVYALAPGMKSKAHFEKGYHIRRVPTLIFYKNGKEVNRFVEHPRQSLAKDMARIVAGKPYVDYYRKTHPHSKRENPISKKKK